MKFWIISVLLASILGCSTSNTDNGDGSITSEPETSKIEIQLNAGIATRATETAFEKQDRIGLYVVNQNEGRN